MQPTPPTPEVMLVTLTASQLTALIESAVSKCLSEKATVIVQPQKDLMRIDEASEFLGVSKNALYQTVHLGKVPYTKQGKALYFSRAELAKWIASGTFKPYKQK